MLDLSRSDDSVGLFSVIEELLKVVLIGRDGIGRKPLFETYVLKEPLYGHGMKRKEERTVGPLLLIYRFDLVIILSGDYSGKYSQIRQAVNDKIRQLLSAASCRDNGL